MQAIKISHYGGPEILKITEVPTPQPKPNEVLIQVKAATLNRTDCGFLRGKPYVVRFFSGFSKPNFPVSGSEFAGQIVAVGSEVTKWQIGDCVFGFDDQQFGGHAQFVCKPEMVNFARMPHNFTFTQAAPLAEAAHYALCDLRALNVKKGDTILINGGTGAIGSAAIQLAKYMGAYVVAVAATPHLQLVKSLGADVVIDYLQEDFTKLNQQFDIVFDAVGKSTFGACKAILKPEGIYLSTELGPNWQNVWLALVTPIYSKKRVLFPIPKMTHEILDYLREAAEKGAYKPVIDRHYKLSEIGAAMAYTETGKKIGNVIIDVAG